MSRNGKSIATCRTEVDWEEPAKAGLMATIGEEKFTCEHKFFLVITASFEFVVALMVHEKFAYYSCMHSCAFLSPACLLRVEPCVECISLGLALLHSI